MSDSATPWIAACQASLSIINSQSSLKLTSIKSVMPSSHLILGHPLLLLPSVPLNIRVFSNESTLRMRWPKYWSFSFSISPSKEIPGLISFRMDWLDLLAVPSVVPTNYSLNIFLKWEKTPLTSPLTQMREKNWRTMRFIMRMLLLEVKVSLVYKEYL